MSLTISPESLGDRHLLLFAPSQLANFLPGRICIRASSAAAASRCGQITLWLLANLLGRQVGVVRQVSVNVPAVPMHPGIALFGHEASLAATLCTTVRMVAGENVTVRQNQIQNDFAEDLTICVGRQETPVVGRHLGVWGTGWRCQIGPADTLSTEDQADSNPLGAMFAACLAAGEAFKAVSRWNGGSAEASNCFSLWDGAYHLNWAALAVGDWPAATEVPPFYLCGAGAVGQALAAALSLCPNRQGHAIVLDREILDSTNLNRYPLGHLDLVGVAKTKIVADQLRSERFTVEPFSLHWEEYVSSADQRTTHPELAKSESSHCYELILSCVDKNPARHSIQSFWPKLILGASTYRLGGQLLRYDVATGGECLKCNNPLPIAQSIEEQAAALRALEPAQLERALREFDPVISAALVEYLKEPKCGMLGEVFINELGQKVRREFSVGFVSVGAGVLLAAGLLQHGQGQGSLISALSNGLGFSFQTNLAQKIFYPKRPDCECGQIGKILHHQLWGY